MAQIPQILSGVTDKNGEEKNSMNVSQTEGGVVHLQCNCTGAVISRLICMTNMLNDITIWKSDVMSHLVRSRGKDTVQCAHCTMYTLYSVTVQAPSLAD